jgi:hypothetical protein
MFRLQADSSLSKSEKEEREVNRLIDKTPAPSRKRAPRRGPKHDNRRSRMKDDDKDLSSKDKDLSLNRKDTGSVLNNIALKIVVGSKTSNENRNDEIMKTKVAQYHGVLVQGHPSGPTNSVPKIDKRDLGKEHYDIIIASAKDFLSEDWFKFGWDVGSEDAGFRAALDMAIYTSCDGTFQSKIDAGTYNILLANLMGIKDDQFSETFSSQSIKKASSTMKETHHTALCRIASSLRSVDPASSFMLLKVASKLNVAGDAPSDDKFFSQAQQGQQGQSKTMNVKDISEQLKLIKEAKDADDLVEALQKLYEGTHVAAGRVAALGLHGLVQGLSEMTEDEISTFVDSIKPEVVKLEGDLKDYFGDAHDAKKDLSSLSDDDVESFMAGVDNLFGVAEKTTEKVTTSSVRISMQTLVRIAGMNPEIKAILIPVLRVAVKKKNKAKKVSQKADPKADEKKPGKDDGKKPSKDGKKPNPFAKGKPEKKDEKKPSKGTAGKKRKASLDFTEEDLSW